MGPTDGVGRFGVLPFTNSLLMPGQMLGGRSPTIAGFGTAESPVTEDPYVAAAMDNFVMQLPRARPADLVPPTRSAPTITANKVVPPVPVEAPRDAPRDALSDIVSAAFQEWADPQGSRRPIHYR